MKVDDMALHPVFGLVQIERLLRDGAAIVWVGTGESAVVSLASLSVQPTLFPAERAA